jgi:hypothetical protein
MDQGYERNVLFCIKAVINVEGNSVYQLKCDFVCFCVVRCDSPQLLSCCTGENPTECLV